MGPQFFKKPPVFFGEVDYPSRIQVVNNRIYVFGGTVYNSSIGYYTSIEAYNIDLDSWEAVNDLSPYLGGSISSCVVNDSIYIFSGRNVNVYNPTTRSWSYGTQKPTISSQNTCSVVNNKVYVIGGSPDADQPLNTVEIYNPQTNTWSNGVSMPTARRMLASAVVNDIIYVVGGATNNDNRTNVAEAYNPDTDTWITLPTMPTARGELTSSVVDGVVYVIGGLGDGVLAVVEAYNPITNSWERMTDMPTKRYWLTSNSVDGKIFVLGGQGETRETVNTLEVFVP